jgi:succinate dehydrogenase / fumarate reductase membrane anchor subunit
MKNIYTSKWVLQRITAIFLIPLTFWFVYQCISFQNSQFQQMKSFFESYLNSFLFLSMMIAMLIHARLGCETIMIDYVNSLNLQKILKSLINIITILTLFLVVGAIFKLNIMQ